jgi:hypothetical protein
MGTDPIRQIPPEFSAQSSDNAGKPFHEHATKTEITTPESERIPHPTVVVESEAKPKRRPPGVIRNDGQHHGGSKARTR